MNDPKQQTNELDRAYDALKQAHDAGNTEDAQQIADYIRMLQPQAKAPKAPVEGLQSPELWALGGVPSALAAGRAMEGFEQGKLREMARQARVHVPEEVIQQGRNAVINYIRAMHTGDINYVGGEDYKRAHALTEEAKMKDAMAPKGMRYDPFKQRYVSELEFQTNLQKVEQERLAQRRANATLTEKTASHSPATARALSGVGGMLRKGVAPPFLERSAAGLYGGYSAADAINRAKQGDVPGSAISGTGALGSALTLSKNPKSRLAGLGLAGLSYIGNKLYESPAEKGPGLEEASSPFYEGAKSFFEYKEGGLAGYAAGGKIGEIVKFAKGFGNTVEPLEASIVTKSGIPLQLKRNFIGKYDAFDEGGNKIASLGYRPDNLGGYVVSGVDVVPEARRKGVASAMYDFLENKVINKPFDQAGGQSESGKLFRESRENKKASGGLAGYAAGGHATPAWQRKEGQNPEGGLNAAGRASYKRETGGELKPPVSAKEAKNSPAKAARRKSFCARMSGMPGPMKDESGKPTRKALALRKWDC